MKTAILVILFAPFVFAQGPAPTPACGPISAQFQIKTESAGPSNAQPDPGKALIYVVEDQLFKAVRDVTLRVGGDGVWVGAMRGNSYLYFSVEAGEHHLCADWVSSFLAGGRAVAFFGFNAEAGKIYYFRARTLGGPPSMGERNGIYDTATIDLDLINSDEGKFLTSHRPYSNSHAKK
jgi:hypothetical protein